MEQSVRPGEKTAVSLISFGHNLMAISVSTFLLYFYTDVVLLPAAAASVLLFVVRLFDGVADLACGYAMDRRRTRYGKYRGYILLAAIPLCIVHVLVFLPVPFRGAGLVVWCLIVYLIWAFLDSVVLSASLPLLVSMTGSQRERYLINTMKIAASIFATLVVRYFTLQLVEKLGGGAESRGFALTMGLFAGVGLLCLIPGSLAVRERNNYSDNKQSPGQVLRLLGGSRKLLLLLLTYLCAQAGSSIMAQSAIYYMKYNLEQPELTSMYLLIGVVSSLLMQPVVVLVARRTQPLTLMAAGYAGAVLATCLMSVIGSSAAALMAGKALYGVVTAFPANVIFVYMAGVSDELSAKGGSSLSGTANSLLGLSARVGASLGGALSALVLYLTAYTPNQAQEKLALFGISLSFFGLTAFFYTLALLLALLSMGMQGRRGESPGREN